MFKRLVTLTLICIVIVPMLTGCWDRIEIEQRATILGLAIDLPEDSVDGTALDVTHPPYKLAKAVPQVHITADIAVPGQISLGPEGGGGGGGSSTEKAIWTVSALGENIADALANLQQEVAESLFLGHLRVIIISEDFAKRGVKAVNDYFRRNPQVRRTTWMMVSKQRAEDAMGVTPPLARVPTLYILATMDRAKDMGKLPNDFAGNYWTLVSSDGQEGYLPYISRIDKQNIKVAGLAYFRGDKMVNTSSPFEIMSYMEIDGDHSGGYTIPLKIGNGMISVTAFRRLSHIATKIENGVPVANVSIHVDANVTERDDGQFNLQSGSSTQRMKRALNTELAQSCTDFIKRTQKDGSDIFGFGEHFRAKHPVYWKQNVRNKSNWEKIYPNLQVHVQVTSRIHRLGMKTS